MNTLGSFTLTAGTPLTVNCAREARWITLRNDSPNYLAVQCGPNAPTNLLVGASYLKTIAPWSGDNYDTGVLPGSFDGNIYLLPTLPTDLPLPGVTQSRSLVSIDTYSAGESPPQPYSGIARQQDLSSQPRIVAIPPIPIFSYQGSWVNSTPQLDLFPDIWGGQTPPNFTIGTNFNLVVYVPYIYLCCTTALTPNADIVQLQCVTKTAGGVVVDTVTIAEGVCAGGGVTSGQVMVPWQVQTPRSRTFRPSATAASAWLRLNLVSGTSTTLVYDITADIDWYNQENVPYIGGGSGGRVDMQTNYPPTGVGFVPQLY